MFSWLGRQQPKQTCNSSCSEYCHKHAILRLTAATNSSHPATQDWLASTCSLIPDPMVMHREPLRFLTEPIPLLFCLRRRPARRPILQANSVLSPFLSLTTPCVHLPLTFIIAGYGRRQESREPSGQSSAGDIEGPQVH